MNGMPRCCDRACKQVGEWSMRVMYKDIFYALEEIVNKRLRNETADVVA